MKQKEHKAGMYGEFGPEEEYPSDEATKIATGT